MKKEIIINAGINEVRIAITEDGQLAEFFIELPHKERLIGNVYFGKVSRIVSGINAAFINIGTNQDAFLHFSDVEENLGNFITDDEDSEDLDNEIDENLEVDNKKSDDKSIAKTTKFKTKKSGDIDINLIENQEVIVQITREAYSHKGVKVTSKIAIPGRYCVLLPYDKMLGVSRKISSFQERKRLRTLAKNILPEGFGCIIRTASRGKSEDELKRDYEYLIEVWKEIDKKIKNSTKPGLVYEDFSLTNSIIRDLFSSDVQRVVIDSKRLYKEIISYIRKVSPYLESKVEHYPFDKPIFDFFGIEKELSKTYKRRVNLQAGGDIVFDHTEAMTVIDVNSGKSSEQDQEKNAFKTNIEAAYEIAKQIRLRDLGGIIIVDFIDMTFDQHKKRLFFEMKRQLERDRAKTIIYPVTQLGLIQITRQRQNQNIAEKITEICPTCKGMGRITSKAVLVNEIEKWLKYFRQGSREFRLLLNVNPIIAAYITDGTISIVSKLMLKYFVKIKVQQNESIQQDSFRFFSVKQQKDITLDYL